MMSVDEAKIINLPKLLDARGNLSFAEQFAQMPFEIRRVPGGVNRGGHAEINNEELVIALSGSFEILINDGEHTRTFTLNRSYYGLYIPKGVWREIREFSTNAVALEFGSIPYSEDDYIRDYDTFCEFAKHPMEPRMVRPLSAPSLLEKKCFHVEDCSIMELDKHHSDRKGNLTVVENGTMFPFSTKRVYYLYDVPGGASRGAHAHKTLEQLIVAVSGSFRVSLDGGTNNVGNPATYNVTTATITLQDPTKGQDRFDGWYDNGSFTGDPITSIPLGSHGNITLYAQWVTRHEIIFDADGVTTTIYRADDEDLSASVAGQGSVPSDPSAPTACSSKVFVGWSESTIDGEADDEPGDLMKPAAGTVNADKHYYAVWATQASTSGPVTVFEDALYGKAANNTTFDTYGDWDSFGYVYGCGTSTEGVRVSSADNAGHLQLKANIGLASVDTIKFKIKSYGDTNGGKITLSSYSGAGTYDNSTSAEFTTTNTSSWEEKTCILRSADNTTDIRFEGEGSKYRIYLKDIKITKAGTVYTYSAYSTSCCATNVTLSHNSPENGTIVFGKTKVPTCGDKEVSLTITPATGYQLHSYEVATGSGKVATKSVSPAILLDNNSSAAQNITLTFADEANGAYDVTASFSKMAPTAWAWTYKSEAIPNPINLYVGQTATLNATYTPSGLLNSEQNYNVTKSANLTQTSKTYATPDIHYTFRADATMDDGTVTLTNLINSSLTITVHVHVDPLPLTHFEDLVHGKAFADVEATLVDNALSATKTTPTSDDWATPNANTCEENHLHLVGWIRKDWPALVAYLAGTGDAPTTTAIVGAGNDGSGNAYFLSPGASINVQTFNDVTFYAVWAEIK